MGPPIPKPGLCCCKERGDWLGWDGGVLNGYRNMERLGWVGLERSLKGTEPWNGWVGLDWVGEVLEGYGAMERLGWVGEVLEGYRAMEWLGWVGLSLGVSL